jgi:hypothetical protein
MLEPVPAQAGLIFVGRTRARHAMARAEINAVLVRLARTGRRGCSGQRIFHSGRASPAPPPNHPIDRTFGAVGRESGPGPRVYPSEKWFSRGGPNVAPHLC